MKHLSPLWAGACIALAAPVARAQVAAAPHEDTAALPGHTLGCTAVSSRTSLAPFAGQPIRAVRVVTLPPQPLPGAIGAIDRIHVQTRPRTVRRQLLFAPGEAVDTLRVAESLRRLRRQRYLADVVVDAVRCEGGQGVDLIVTTRDDWSTKPNLRVGSSASVLGVSERNVLGTGREASLYVRADGSRLGLGTALRDPWFLGGKLNAFAATNSYGDGHDWTVAVATRQRDVYEPWRGEANLSSLTRRAPTALGDAFQRTMGRAMLARTVHASPTAVTALLGGVELDRTRMSAASDAVIVGPGRVQRDFRGLDVGIARTAVAYDTLTWLLPVRALVDVPVALEAEALVAAGRDVATGRPALHVDAWSGRMWRPAPGHLVVGDLWASGYAEKGVLSAATLRGALALFRAAPRGRWGAWLVAERLVRPDPDVRSFTSFDPTAPALADRARLADATLGSTLEREARIVSLNRAWSLSAAGFASASLRLEPALAGTGMVGVGVLGAGLRLAPNKAGRGTARIDVGVPVTGTPGVRRRPFVAISVMPSMEQLRRRDGRREQ